MATKKAAKKVEKRTQAAKVSVGPAPAYDQYSLPVKELPSERVKGAAKTVVRKGASKMLKFKPGLNRVRILEPPDQYNLPNTERADAVSMAAQLKVTPERPSERAMNDVAQVAVAINGRLTLTAAVVREAKALQQAKNALEADLEALAAKLKAKEQAIIAALDAGLPVESGCPAVAVERQERITPKWKDEAILLVKAAGRNVEVYEAEVRARTPVTVVTRLVINGDVKKG
jgi:hypothetical protein